MKQDPRIDAYIARQAAFAQPILTYLRAAVHAACPEVEETLKWSMPAFVYKQEILAMMAAFKTHAAFNFWRGAQVVETTGREKEAMGQFGRITSLAEAPGEPILVKAIRQAVALADAGIKPLRTRPRQARAVSADPPSDFQAALAAQPAAAKVFAAFSPSARRDYIEWITAAKQAATRQHRIAQAVAWIAEGKKRNWKYEKC